MSRAIVLWGATGHAKVLSEFLPALGYELVALFDNDASVEPPLPGVPLYHGFEGLERWLGENGRRDADCLVAIGGAKGRDRLELQRDLAGRGLPPALAVHPRAFVAEGAVLGAGSQVLANAAVCAEAVLGEACIVNTSASVDHECRLGEGVHVGPGATLAGCVDVGDGSLVGAGAVVLPRVRIGSDAVVGAGAVVTRDVPDGIVVAGNPARSRAHA